MFRPGRAFVDSRTLAGKVRVLRRAKDGWLGTTGAVDQYVVAQLSAVAHMVAVAQHYPDGRWLSWQRARCPPSTRWVRIS